jgi:phosphoglycolate phosphatase
MTKGPVIRAAFIDLDGTLVDTLSEMTAAINATLQDAGRPTVGPDVVANAVGEGAAMLIAQLFGAQATERWLPVYLEHYRASNGSSATLYPNVVEGLAALRAMGLAIACVTNKPRELVGPLLDRLRILAAFDTLVGGGDTIDKKPKPAPILEACRRLDVDATQVVMIGDSINDALAANAAGAISLTVPYGYPGSAGDDGRADALLARGVTRAVVDDLAAAARWIAAR